MNNDIQTTQKLSSDEILSNPRIGRLIYSFLWLLNAFAGFVDQSDFSLLKATRDSLKDRSFLLRLIASPFVFSSFALLKALRIVGAFLSITALIMMSIGLVILSTLSKIFTSMITIFGFKRENISTLEHLNNMVWNNVIQNISVYPSRKKIQKAASNIFNLFQSMKNSLLGMSSSLVGKVLKNPNSQSEKSVSLAPDKPIDYLAIVRGFSHVVSILDPQMLHRLFASRKNQNSGLSQVLDSILNRGQQVSQQSQVQTLKEILTLISESDSHSLGKFLQKLSIPRFMDLLCALEICPSHSRNHIERILENIQNHLEDPENQNQLSQQVQAFCTLGRELCEQSEKAFNSGLSLNSIENRIELIRTVLLKSNMFHDMTQGLNLDLIQPLLENILIDSSSSLENQNEQKNILGSIIASLKSLQKQVSIDSMDPSSPTITVLDALKTQGAFMNTVIESMQQEARVRQKLSIQAGCSQAEVQERIDSLKENKITEKEIEHFVTSQLKQKKTDSSPAIETPQEEWDWELFGRTYQAISENQDKNERLKNALAAKPTQEISLESLGSEGLMIKNFLQTATADEKLSLSKELNCDFGPQRHRVIAILTRTPLALALPLPLVLFEPILQEKNSPGLKMLTNLLVQKFIIAKKDLDCIANDKKKWLEHPYQSHSEEFQAAQKESSEQIAIENGRTGLMAMVASILGGFGNPPLVKVNEISWKPDALQPEYHSEVEKSSFALFLDALLIHLRNFQQEHGDDFENHLLPCVTPILIGMICPKLAIAYRQEEKSAQIEKDWMILKDLVRIEVSKYSTINELLIHITPDVVQVLQRYGETGFIQFVLEQFYSYSNEPADPSVISRMLHYVIVDANVDPERTSRLCKAIGYGDFKEIMKNLCYTDDTYSTFDQKFITDFAMKDREGMARLIAKNILTAFPPRQFQRLDQCIDLESQYTKELIEVLTENPKDWQAIIESLTELLMLNDNPKASLSEKIQKVGKLLNAGPLKTFLEKDPISPMLTGILCESENLAELLSDLIPSIQIARSGLAHFFDEDEHLSINKKNMRAILGTLKNDEEQSLQKILKILASNAEALSQSKPLPIEKTSELISILCDLFINHTELREVIARSFSHEDYSFAGTTVKITSQTLLQIAQKLKAHPELISEIIHYGVGDHPGLFHMFMSQYKVLPSLVSSIFSADIIPLQAPRSLLGMGIATLQCPIQLYQWTSMKIWGQEVTQEKQNLIQNQPVAQKSEKPQATALILSSQSPTIDSKKGPQISTSGALYKK